MAELASNTWYAMSLVRDIEKLPWFMACAAMTASKLLSSTICLA